MLTVGEPAPDFHAKSHAGEMVSLASQRGKNVMLRFYPKADTPGCTAEGCAIRDLSAEFEKRNTVVFGVSFDEEAENAAFVEKFDFPFALLCDTDREVVMRGRRLGRGNDLLDAAIVSHDDRIGEGAARVDSEQ